MYKRKRSYETLQKPESDSNDFMEASGHQRQQLSRVTLDQYEKMLFRALKLARGFERQKLGRRQKVAKQAQDHADTARLNAEVAALKALDLSKVAQLHLYKSLLKSKAMSAAPAFPSYISAKIEVASRPLEIASCNVQARLFNTNTVKTTMVEVMSAVGSILGIPDGAISGKKGRLRASDIVRVGDLTKISAGGAGETREGHTIIEQKLPQIYKLPVSHDAHQEKFARSDEGSDEHNAYSARLGSPSDISTGENPAQESLKKELIVDHKTSRATSSLSYSKSPSVSVDSTPERSHIAAAASKSTTFLPCLTLGGYISDSDSSHSLASKTGLRAPEPRKNRRGQQARRQIWEKKYGRNARHLQRQAQSQNRDRDWDPRAGARPTNDRIKGRRDRRQGPNRGSRAVPLSSGANADPIKARPTEGESKGKPATGSLHPSWEAAKRAKEATKSVTFQGKKLVFD